MQQGSVFGIVTFSGKKIKSHRNRSVYNQKTWAAFIKDLFMYFFKKHWRFKKDAQHQVSNELTVFWVANFASLINTSNAFCMAAIAAAEWRHRCGYRAQRTALTEHTDAVLTLLKDIKSNLKPPT